MVFSTYINRTLHTDSLNSVIWHHVGPIQCMHFKNYPTNSRMDPLQDLTLAEFLNLINLHEHYIYCNQPIPLIKVLKKIIIYKLFSSYSLFLKSLSTCILCRAHYQPVINSRSSLQHASLSDAYM